MCNSSGHKLSCPHISAECTLWPRYATLEKPHLISNKHGVLSMGRKHHAYHDSNMILWNNLHPSGVLRSVYQKTLDVASCKGRLQLHNFALGFASGCGMIFTGWIRVTYGDLLPVAQKYAEYPVQIHDMRLPKNWSQQIPTNHIPIPWSSSRQTMRWRTSETKPGTKETLNWTTEIHLFNKVTRAGHTSLLGLLGVVITQYRNSNYHNCTTPSSFCIKGTMRKPFAAISMASYLQLSAQMHEIINYTSTLEPKC